MTNSRAQRRWPPCAGSAALLLGSLILGAITEATGAEPVTLSVVTVRTPAPSPQRTPGFPVGKSTSSAVSAAMRAAIRDLPMTTLTLRAECAGDWALVSAPMEEGDDLAVVLSPRGNGYRLYASFPSSRCVDWYRADGGPAAFASRFPPC